MIIEGAALPLVHADWLTAMVFTVANLVLLRVRVRVEEAALATTVRERDRIERRTPKP